MVIVDRDIKLFIANGTIPHTEQTAIVNGSEDNITGIGYDLVAANLYIAGKAMTLCELKPGESVFVESKEIVRFDRVTVGHVYLKNSRLRMGLTLDAPVYQPGHETMIYFRLTNISSDMITIQSGEQYAMLTFEQLKDEPDKKYEGTFQKEFSFVGLGDYKSQYMDSIQSISDEIKSLRDIEKRLYGNVITILTIFVAAFTLLNLNITLAKAYAEAKDYLIFNLSTLGAVSFLSVLIGELIHDNPKRVLWLIPTACFVAVLLVSLFCA